MAMPERPNVFEPAWEAEVPAPFAFRATRVGHAAGARQLGASLYELDPGGAASPLHTHWANEELVIALTAGVTLRTPDAERVLEPGELVACPPGPDGAHQLRNRGEAAARVLVVSTMRVPEVAEHLDSGKVVTITRHDESAVEAFRRADAVAPMLDEPGG